MSPTRLTGLVILGLLLGGVPAFAGDHRRSPEVVIKGPTLIENGRKKHVAWEIRGWGLTREDADQAALENVRTELLDYLSAQGLREGFTPSEREIRGLVKDSKWGETRKINGGDLHEARLRVELSSKELRSYVEQERQFKAQQRMTFLGKILAGLVALLGAVAGYCRLEEATKGYYTAWLRLGVVGFLAAVGAVIFALA